MQNLCFGIEYTISGCRSCEASILLHLTQNDVWECFGAFRKPSTGKKRCKTCVSGLNTLFRGTEVVKHPFYSIGPKLIFGSVSEHFASLRQVTRCQTCVLSLNTLFWGVKVVKHPFHSIWAKMMFGSVSEHFDNLRQVQRCKTLFRAWIHYFGVSKLWSIHSTPFDPKWFLGVFRSISQTFDG
jgi:hypothetical protein